MKPYSFSIAKWESKAIPHEINRAIFGKHDKIDDKVHLVTEYFSLTERIKTLESEIETTTSKRQDSPTSLEAGLLV